MNERVYETIAEIDPDDLPSNPDKFIEAFKALIEKIPAELRDTAELEWDTEYESSSVSLTIRYLREQTAEEIQAERERHAEYQARMTQGKWDALGRTMAEMGIRSVEIDGNQLKYVPNQEPPKT